MRLTLCILATVAMTLPALADPLAEVSGVEGQPLGQNADRIAKALDFLGKSMPANVRKDLNAAIEARDAKKIQEILDPQALLQVTLNPESRVKVARGPAAAVAQQSGWTPAIIKVVNDSTVKKPLRASSPQAGPVQSQRDVKKDFSGRFLELEMFTAPPLTKSLSGLKVEYAILLIYSSEAGKREATIGFDVGQGTQDLGFRGEAPVLFEIKPAIAVKIGVKDENGKPTVGRFTFTDAAGHVYPPRAKRLAPDFFFQNQVYREDGGTVLLPPGEFIVTYGRGPEYQLKSQKLKVEDAKAKFDVVLERWVDPAQFGWYSGDHHIHAAGCAHYTSPTEGVFPHDMFVHVKGEGLNVGCCLTWGPCFEFQRTFFEPAPNKLSEPFTLLKYDIEVSGFGSQALGHVCLLNLRDETYPGSEGTKTKGWPTWTTPVMRWTKLQGGFTGYAHSANGLTLDRPQDRNIAASGLIAALDTNNDGAVSADEAAKGVLPESFEQIDSNSDGKLSEMEIAASINRVKNKLPNLAIPAMNGIGAQEICVSSAMKVCDFISAMDTARAGMELLVPHHELRVPAQGERRDGFPVHLRQPRRPGPGVCAAGENRQSRLREVVRGACQGAILRQRRLQPCVAVHRERSAGRRRSETRSTRSRDNQSQGRLLGRTAVRHIGGRQPAGGRHSKSRIDREWRCGRGERRPRRPEAARYRILRPARQEQLDRDPPEPDHAHEPGDRDRPRQADPSIAQKRPLVHRRHQATLARARK